MQSPTHEVVPSRDLQQSMRTAVRVALLIFCSSFLLFAVQPILGKALLPEWGGGANVWTACLLFFQIGLLIGYLYAFVSARWLARRAQAAVHILLIATSLAWLPIALRIPIEALADQPALDILFELTWSIGLPFVVLSSTSPLLSHWRMQSDTRREPYWLYAVSNLGSLAACVAYPFVIEPAIGLAWQQTAWSCAYAALTLAWVWHAIEHLRNPAMNTQEKAMMEPSTSLQPRWLAWTALSACSSIVLAASTSSMSQAGVVVPGLWVLPLALYLLSWSVAFRWPFLGRWSNCVGLYFLGSFLILVLLIVKLWVPWLVLIFGYSSAVLCISLACHALLHALRPPPKDLTSFYLAIAIGGVLGSAFVALVAPELFDDYFEMHVGLALGAVVIGHYYATALWPGIGRSAWVSRVQWPATLVLPILLVGTLWMHANVPSAESVITRKRDFYGAVSVVERPKTGFRSLVFGHTVHGVEPLDGELHPDRTLYYRTDSGVGLAWGWCHRQQDRPLRVGLIGLGTGSLSLYASVKDHLTYYEISPAVIEIAKENFHYLAAHVGTTEIKLGDGRVLMARDASGPKMDLVIVDAFSNDSLPMHLLTLQAIATYRDRMQTDGLLAFNITNRNLDLAPVLFAAGKATGLVPLLIESPMPQEPFSDKQATETNMVRWVLMFPPETIVPQWPGMQTQPSRAVSAWTDDYGSPLQALRR